MAILLIGINLPWSDTVREKVFTFKNLYMAITENSVHISTVLPYCITSLTMIASLVICIYISKEEKNPIILVTILSAFLTEGIMVMAPYSPLRSTLTSIIFFILTIGYIYYLAIEKKYSMSVAFTIVLTIYNNILGIFTAIAIILIKDLKIDKDNIEKEVLATIIVLIIISMNNWYQVYYGYKINKEIYYENISKIEKFVEEYPTKEEQEGQELQIYLPIDEKYGFVAMTGIDWVETAVKEYFEINANVKISGNEKNIGG